METPLLASKANFLQALEIGKENKKKHEKQFIEYRDVNEARAFVKPIQFGDCN